MTEILTVILIVVAVAVPAAILERHKRVAVEVARNERDHRETEAFAKAVREGDTGRMWGVLSAQLDGNRKVN